MEQFSYDVIAEFYDEDMGRNTDGADIAFYRDRGLNAHGKILELGCGTGRITIPLAQAGCDITGIDRSLPMLRVLEQKSLSLSATVRNRLKYVVMDMKSLELRGTYSLVICPYSVFTYLVALSDQVRVLQWIHSHLEPEGECIIDVFTPSAAVESFPDDHVFHDYERKRTDGTWLCREKKIRKNVHEQINIITRMYAIKDDNKNILDSFETSDTIHYFRPGELRALLAAHGFCVTEEYGGFHGEPLSPASGIMLFIAKPIL